MTRACIVHINILMRYIKISPNYNWLASWLQLPHEFLQPWIPLLCAIFQPLKFLTWVGHVPSRRGEENGTLRAPQNSTSFVKPPHGSCCVVSWYLSIFKAQWMYIITYTLTSQMSISSSTITLPSPSCSLPPILNRFEMIFSPGPFSFLFTLLPPLLLPRADEVVAKKELIDRCAGLPFRINAAVPWHAHTWANNKKHNRDAKLPTLKITTIHTHTHIWLHNQRQVREKDKPTEILLLTYRIAFLLNAAAPYGLIT